MESIIGALIGAIGGIIATATPFIINKKISDKEKRKLQASIKDRNIVDIGENHSDTLEWHRLFKDATHDIFLSGLTLSRLHTMTKHIKKFDDKKKLRLLSLNIDDDELFTVFCKMRKGDAYTNSRNKTIAQSNLSKETYKELIYKKNIIRKVTKRLIPCEFIAIDCGIDIDNGDEFVPNDNSVIKASFYIPDKSCHDEMVLVTAVYGTELFNGLKNYIEVIWKESLDIE